MAGWAIDLGAPSGTGIREWIDVYSAAVGGSGMGTHVRRGERRPAPAGRGRYYGPQFTNSGYGVSVSGLAPGTYTLNVYAFSTVSGTWSVAITYNVTVQ